MKVLLINGSPHEKGCTYTALMELAERCAFSQEIWHGFSSAKALVWRAGVPFPKQEQNISTNFIR